MDPVALASLIVGVASLAWTIYADLRKHAAEPAAEVTVNVVVTEAIGAATDEEDRASNHGICPFQSGAFDAHNQSASDPPYPR